MKKNFVFAVCFCIIQNGLYAQSPQSPEKQKARQSQNPAGEQKKSNNKSLSKSLGLSKDQSQKINDYKKEGKKRKAEIMNNKDLSQQQKDAALKSLKKENKAKINSVLTADQKTKLKEMKKNRTVPNTAKQ